MRMLTLVPLSQIRNLLEFADKSFPNETSGLLLSQILGDKQILSLAPTSDKDNSPITFRIRDLEIKEVEKDIKNSTKQICGCFHSHIRGRARPSKMDQSGKKKKGELWLIYSVKFSQLKIFEWDGSNFFPIRYRIIL